MGYIGGCNTYITFYSIGMLLSWGWKSFRAVGLMELQAVMAFEVWVVASAVSD